MNKEYRFALRDSNGPTGRGLDEYITVKYITVHYIIDPIEGHDFEKN